MQLSKDRKIKDIHESEIRCVALNETCNFIATCADEEPVIIRKYPYMKMAKKIVHREKFLPRMMICVIILLKPRKIPMISKADDQNDSAKQAPKGPIISATKLIFSHSGAFLLVGYENGDFLGFNTKSWEKIVELNVSIGICNIQLTNNDTIVYVVNWDCNIITIDAQTWEIKDTKEIKIPNTGYGILSQNGSTLFTITDKKRVRAVNLTTFEEIAVYKGT